MQKTDLTQQKQQVNALADKLWQELIVSEHIRSSGAGPAFLSSNIDSYIDDVIAQHAAMLSETTRSQLKLRVLEHVRGLGPLEALLEDPEVSEIMVNGHDTIWVERAGSLFQHDSQFVDVAALRHAINRILAPIGRRVDETVPFCDARLPDGSRVNVVIPPIAVDSPILTIRRFGKRHFTPLELVHFGACEQRVMNFLKAAVAGRCNVLISGSTSSGKTTLLNALTSFIGADERIITIEDTAELRLQQQHVVRLEARAQGLDGRGEITIRQLVRNALRMRPDRIVVGEVRGGEALDMLAALATGHDGSLSTIHAGSPYEAFERLETLTAMADVKLPYQAIRVQAARAVDFIVQQGKTHAGKRFVQSVAAVTITDNNLQVELLWEQSSSTRKVELPSDTLLRKKLFEAGWPGSSLEQEDDSHG